MKRFCHLIVLSGLVLLCRLDSQAAEDPARFLAVQSWRGTFGQDTSMVGSRTTPSSSGDCVVEFSFIHHVNPSGVILSNTFGAGDLRWWFSDGGRIPNAGNIRERVTLTCPDFTSRHTADGGDVGGIFMVQIDAAATNYVLQFPTIYANVAADGGPSVEFGGGWGPTFITNDLPATGMTLSGSFTTTLDHHGIVFLPLPLPATEVQQLLRSTALVISWSLTPVVEELELVIESDRYEEWLPLGNVKDWRQPGDILFFTAALQQTNGEPAQSRAKTMKFELMEVSAEKGVCMNRPTEQFANTEPDLRFQGPIDRPPTVSVPLSVQDEGMTAITPEGDYEVVEAGISSFDFGGRGKLKVTAMVNGHEIVGYWQNDPAKERKPLLLPKRKEESWIADKWKEDEGVDEVADTEDEENEPVGDGHKGDGLSLYEEYRGFSHNLTHLRANPRKKDLFIADNIRNADSMTGIAVFKTQSGLEIHEKMRTEEFKVSLAAGAYSSFLNFNHSGGDRHIVDQHGLIILAKSSSDGVSRADGPRQGGTPGFYQRVLIDQAAYGWRTVGGGAGARILTFQGASVIAHELSHACAVYHHGGGDEEKVLWVQQSEGITENGLEIEPRLEFGGGFMPWFGTNGSRRVWIGVPQGQHSGHMECLMRYTTANAYRSRLPGENRVRYWVDEVEGIILCTTGDGTGVNAGGRTPQSRYGATAPNRGNCKGQICVNDLYGPGDHSR